MQLNEFFLIIKKGLISYKNETLTHLSVLSVL